MQQEGFELPEDGVFQITLQKAAGKPQKIQYIGVFEPSVLFRRRSVGPFGRCGGDNEEVQGLPLYLLL